MVELAFRGKERKKPERIEPQKKKRSPYLIPLVLLAPLALIPFLGVIGTPSPSLVLSSNSQISAVTPTVFPAQGFSCRTSPEIANDSRFAFDTNSRLDSFSIDRQSKVITVGVSGTEGSEGTFCINVPKDFIPTRELRSSVDNIPWNSRVEEFSNSNVVSLAYHHSERVIRIFGEPLTPSPTPPTNATQPSGAGGGQQQQQQVVVVLPGAGTPSSNPSPNPPPTPQPANPCFDANLTDPKALVASGIPVVFTSGERPQFTSAQPDASGIRAQTKTRAIVNYISDVGETIGVSFKLDNLSSEDSLVRIRTSSPDTLLVDVVKSGGIDVVKPIKSNEYLVRLKGGAAGAELIANITSLTPGFHPFLLEILPLVEQPVCP